MHGIQSNPTPSTSLHTDLLYNDGTPLQVVKSVLSAESKQNGGLKIFVNIAESDTVDPPKSHTVKRNGKTGTNWSLPHSTTTHREDVDKSGGTCIVYDSIFNPQVSADYFLAGHICHVLAVEGVRGGGVEQCTGGARSHAMHLLYPQRDDPLFHATLLFSDLFCLLLLSLEWRLGYSAC
jgi:hypothetical protein